MKSSVICPGASLPRPAEVRKNPVETATQDQPAEEKIRSAHKCMKSGCVHWSQGNCGVIRRALKAVEENARATGAAD